MTIGKGASAICNRDPPRQWSEVTKWMTQAPGKCAAIGIASTKSVCARGNFLWSCGHLDGGKVAFGGHIFLFLCEVRGGAGRFPTVWPTANCHCPLSNAHALASKNAMRKECMYSTTA